MASIHGMGQRPSFVNETQNQAIYDLYHGYRQPVTPKGQQTMMELLEQSPNFQIMTQWVRRSGLEATLRDPNVRLTFFVVPDPAFHRMPGHMWKELDDHDAKKIVEFNLLRGMFALRDFTGTRKFYRTYYPRENLVVDGRGLNVRVGFRHHSSSVNPTVNYTAQVIGADHLASNGIVHVLNLPLIPGA